MSTTEQVVRDWPGELHIEIGGRIRKVRESRGLYRYELADAAGIAPSTLGGIENGQATRLEVLYRIAEVLEIPVHGLLPRRGLGWFRRALLALFF